jgi:antitoxin YefM
MTIITASQARQQLFPLIERINEDHAPVHITSRKGNAVLVSERDWDAWQETLYLFSSPANSRRLTEALARSEAGEYESHSLIDL